MVTLSNPHPRLSDPLTLRPPARGVHAPVCELCVFFFFFFNLLFVPFDGVRGVVYCRVPRALCDVLCRTLRVCRCVVPAFRVSFLLSD